jgi:hypothetical protein
MRSTLLSLLGLGLVGVLAIGCSPEAGDEETGEGSAQLGQSRRQLTICFSGAAVGSPYNSGGNSELGDLCNRMPGTLIKAGRFPFFTWGLPEEIALEAFIATADTNHDGRVTSADEAFDLNVIGFSWGGYNARDFINMIDDSRRIEIKTVERFFALDAFKISWLSRKTSMAVPENVRHYWAFRHSESPDDDCSDSMPWGPFTGRKPTCSGTTECTDYDYSLAPNSYFAGYRGSSVGHCDVPAAATNPILDITAGRTPGNVPPTHPVERDD